MNSNFGNYKSKRLLVVIGVLLVVFLAYSGYKKYANSVAEGSLKQKAPQTAQVAKNSFWGDVIYENNEEFSCYDASRKFASSDRYCRLQYEVRSTPEKDVSANHTKYRHFADSLISDEWSLVYLTSTNYWRDTANVVENGSDLVADDEGDMNLSGKKDLGSGAWCNLQSQYVSKKPHHNSDNGVLNYSIDCFYQVM